MRWSWFDLAWPWIGLFASGVLLALLFGTHKLQENKRLSRWRDPVWLAWLMSAVYMLHNFEEYGIDALGQPHAFPILTCAALHQPPYPACVNSARILSWRQSFCDLGWFRTVRHTVPTQQGCGPWHTPACSSPMACRTSARLQRATDIIPGW